MTEDCDNALYKETSAIVHRNRAENKLVLGAFYSDENSTANLQESEQTVDPAFVVGGVVVMSSE